MKRKMVLFLVLVIFIITLLACSKSIDPEVSTPEVSNPEISVPEVSAEDIIPADPITSEDKSDEGINSDIAQYIIGDSTYFGGYEWLILDIRDGKALLLSEDIIALKYANISDEADKVLKKLENDTMQSWRLKDFEAYSAIDSKYDGIYEAYSDYASAHPKIFNDEMWDSSWEQSSLRKWLNSEMNFTSEEWDMIETTEVIDKLGVGENAFDKVFLLDKDDVEKYFPRNESRGATSIASDEEILYLLKQSILTGKLSGNIAKKAINTRSGGIFYWWIRGSEPTDRGFIIPMAPMSTDDELNSIAPSYGAPLGVRPAIWIRINE